MNLDIATPRAQISAAYDQAKSFADQIRELLIVAVTNDDQATWAGQTVQQLANAKAGFLERREGGMKPIRELLAWLESMFPMDVIKAIDAVIDHLKSTTKVYVDAQRQVQAAALAEARSHAEVQRAVQVLAPAIPAGFTERAKPWTYRVVDETKVPRAYWLLDEKTLGKLARTLKDKMNIPGIEAYQEGTTLARSAQ